MSQTVHERYTTLTVRPGGRESALTKKDVETSTFVVLLIRTARLKAFVKNCTPLPKLLVCCQFTTFPSEVANWKALSLWSGAFNPVKLH